MDLLVGMWSLELFVLVAPEPMMALGLLCHLNSISKLLCHRFTMDWAERLP